MVFAKMLADLKIMRTFAPTIERESIGRKIIKIIGALVQLVRIHACHAWGHGFESRTHREKILVHFESGFFISYKWKNKKKGNMPYLAHSRQSCECLFQYFTLFSV